MPSPVYSAGSPGNVINGANCPASKSIAALYDLSAAFEARLTCEVSTTTAPTAGTTFTAYPVYGEATANTLSGPVSSGATTLSASSSAGIHAGQAMLLVSAATSQGEIVTVGTSGITGTGPYSIPIAAGTANSYSDGVLYAIEQSTTHVLSPSSSWAANDDYSAPMTVGTGRYAIVAANADTAAAVTITVSASKITAYQ